MFSKTILASSLIFIGVTHAFPNAEPLPAHLVARQGSACTLGPDYSSLLAGQPTAPPELQTAAASFLVTASDLCATPAFTGSLSSEYASFKSAEVSWVSANKPALESVASSLEAACPGVSSIVGAFSSLLATCTNGGGSGGATTGVSTGASTATSGSAATATSQAGGAPAQTMMAAAGAIVAGAFGILAL